MRPLADGVLVYRWRCRHCGKRAQQAFRFWRTMDLPVASVPAGWFGVNLHGYSSDFCSPACLAEGAQKIAQAESQDEWEEALATTTEETPPCILSRDERWANWCRAQGADQEQGKCYGLLMGEFCPHRTLCSRHSGIIYDGQAKEESPQ